MPTTVLESLNGAMHRLFDADERVLLIGEDLLDPYGGAFKLSKGLSTRFPNRVWTTPISESGIVGLSVGLALRGYRPIAEIMFGDFLTLAADQIINHAAKFRWMFNESVRVPLVIRAPMGGRRGYGPTHSQSLEKHFIGVPGLWVVAPSIFGDPGALLEQSICWDDPVLFIESKTCYGRAVVDRLEGTVATRIATTDCPFPTQVFRWPASDGLVCCYGSMAPVAHEAVTSLARDEGLHFDLAVISQLSPTPLSHLAALAGVAANVTVVVEEASTMGGWSADIIAALERTRSERGALATRYLQFGAKHEPIGSSRALEKATLPQAERLHATILEQF